MSKDSAFVPSRRQFLAGAGAVALSPMLRLPGVAASVSATELTTLLGLFEQCAGLISQAEPLSAGASAPEQYALAVRNLDAFFDNATVQDMFRAAPSLGSLDVKALLASPGSRQALADFAVTAERADFAARGKLFVESQARDYWAEVIADMHESLASLPGRAIPEFADSLAQLKPRYFAVDFPAGSVLPHGYADSQLALLDDMVEQLPEAMRASVRRDAYLGGRADFPEVDEAPDADHESPAAQSWSLRGQASGRFLPILRAQARHDEPQCDISTAGVEWHPMEKPRPDTEVAASTR